MSLAKDINDRINEGKLKVGDNVKIAKTFYDKDFHGEKGKISYIETDEEGNEVAEVELDDEDTSVDVSDLVKA